MTAQVIDLPDLHPSQLAIAKDPSRFKVVCCGRRYGKTLLGITLSVRAAVKGKRIWWVGPTYKQAMEGWAYLLQMSLQIPNARILKGELEVHFPGGGRVQIRTEGGDPNNLRGSGLDGVVLDEAAIIKPESWELVLRPALADKQGWALFISTPQHFNWFYDLFTRGERGDEGWASWQHPTWDNPFILQSEIDAAQLDMEPEDFDQEFGASFTAVGGAIFPLLALNRPTYLRPMPQGLQFKRTGVGMDWGTTKQHNAAVVSGSVMSTGVVWIRSAWLDYSASSNLWRDEAFRCKNDYGATFARVDRSQSSELDRLIGFDAKNGIPDVSARIGDFQGLVRRRAIYFDSHGPGVVDYYNHLCAYHRHPDWHAKAGTPVEEEDDDVDAGCYLVSELTGTHRQAPSREAEQAHGPNARRELELAARRGGEGLIRKA